MPDRPRLFVSNFDFEHRLVHGEAKLPRAAEQFRSAVAAGWRLISREGDTLWWPGRESPGGWESLDAAGWPLMALVSRTEGLAASHDVVFWAEDDWALQICRRWGFPWRGCDPRIVRRVNSRRFQTRLENDLGVAPAGLRMATNVCELTTAVAALDKPAGWVLKNEFGAAGRESCRGRGALPANLARWATARFQRGMAIVVEPRLDVLEEASIQFAISRTGEITCLGIVGGLASPGGKFLASKLLSDEQSQRWEKSRTIATRAARRLAEEGYWGPLGIDAMLYRDQDGRERLRPIQDINARYTIGRLAMGMRNYPELMDRQGGRFATATWR